MFNLTGKATHRLLKKDKLGNKIHLKYYDEEDSHVSQLFNNISKDVSKASNDVESSDFDNVNDESSSDEEAKGPSAAGQGKYQPQPDENEGEEDGEESEHDEEAEL
jgi:hypothetical protein